VVETYRPGITLRLSAQLDNHKLMGGYWYDRASERRTRPALAFNSNGVIGDMWLNHSADYIRHVDGTPFMGRDWLTISTSQSLFLQDDISLLDNRLNLSLGIRRASISRDFTNYAHDRTDGGADYQIHPEFAKTLPQLAARYRLDEAQHIFFSVAKNFATPASNTYGKLLTGGTFVGGVLTGYSMVTPHVKPEQSTNWDVGYRYSDNNFNLSASAFYIQYRDRIDVAYDPQNDIRTDFNVGDTQTRGLELEYAWRFTPKWSLYHSLTYTRSRLQDDMRTAAGTFEPTAGKQYPDTPTWMSGAALQYRQGPFTGTLSAKYTGRRYTTEVNDESLSSFTLVNLDLRYQLADTAFFRKPFVRFNVANLFNTDYLYLDATSGATLQVRAQGSGGIAPSYFVGAPRTWSVTIASDF